MTYKSNVVPKSANIRGVQMVVFNLARFNGVHLIEYHSYLNFILVANLLLFDLGLHQGLQL